MSKAIWKHGARCGARAASRCSDHELVEGLAVELLAARGARSAQGLLQREVAEVLLQEDAARARPRRRISGTGRPQPAIRLPDHEEGQLLGVERLRVEGEDARARRRRSGGSSGASRRRRRAGTTRDLAGRARRRRSARKSDTRWSGDRIAGKSDRTARWRAEVSRPRRPQPGAPSGSPCGARSRAAGADQPALARVSRSRHPRRPPPGWIADHARSRAHAARGPTARSRAPRRPPPTTRPGPPPSGATRARGWTRGLGVDERPPPRRRRSPATASVMLRGEVQRRTAEIVPRGPHAHPEQAARPRRSAARRGRARCPTGPAAAGRAARDRATWTPVKSDAARAPAAAARRCERTRPSGAGDHRAVGRGVGVRAAGPGWRARPTRGGGATQRREVEVEDDVAVDEQERLVAEEARAPCAARRPCPGSRARASTHLEAEGAAVAHGARAPCRAGGAG